MSEIVRNAKPGKYTSSRVRKAIRNAICDSTVAEILEQFAEDLEREEGLRRRYTAQDVRTAMQVSACDAKTARVLMRYAKYLEKNSRRRKYEYGLKDEGGFVCRYHSHTPYGVASMKNKHETVVRREVGEWEDVSSN